ncbi:MAG: undecaprenyl-diphosphate phosphatase [Clostridia bacterium]|nr:undecaprenyl-diphosphate phosphatase [Clostridia bacterium]
MDIFQAFILGVIQGLTEFLPISSSGHLVLVQRLFGISEGALTFGIAVHLATLLAVMAVLWEDVVNILKKPFGKLPLLIIAGTIPTIVIAVAFKDLFEKLFNTGSTLGLEFIFTGLILWFSDSMKSRGKVLEKTSYADAAIIGLAQGVAILPAVSRSGLTIAGALFRGLDREFAARFSFLLSIPAILGAAVFDGYDLIKNSAAPGGGIDFLPLAVGMVAAAVSGYFAVRFMIKLLSKGSMKVFSYYVFILGALVLFEQIFIGRLFGRLF